MANSDSTHSKQLRYQTAKEWDKKNIITKPARFNKNNPEDIENLEIFEKMEGKPVDKFRELFRVYKQYKKRK